VYRYLGSVGQSPIKIKKIEVNLLIDKQQINTRTKLRGSEAHQGFSLISVFVIWNSILNTQLQISKHTVVSCFSVIVILAVYFGLSLFVFTYYWLILYGLIP